ncbi:hypothetical protein TNCT_516341 [Trichonephila clavata]|uniref:Uncharacterized protein n=1 Tax=Trichonephila clavata TaxID=2740835 RepID=A0A8X6IQF9_TRICU|nr:hypothetical protein TNCT_516341 [Trichonephila clavata]
MEADEDLKILARIKSKERMQATRNRRKEEQKVIGPRCRFRSSYKIQKAIPYPAISPPSVSNQRKSFLPLKTRLHVSDVYNDSDSDPDNESINEESPPPSYQASKSPAEAYRKTDGTVSAAVLRKDICAGLYVLVQQLCKSGKNYSLSLCGGVSERYG